jgi:hypothetical protein
MYMELDLAIHWIKLQYFRGENIKIIGFISPENHSQNAIEALPKTRNKSRLEPKVLFKIKNNTTWFQPILNASILNMGNTRRFLPWLESTII